MRKLLTIMLAGLFLASCNTTVKTDTPEQTAEAVYNVVLANDAEALKGLLLTKEEIEQYMKDNQIENMEIRMAEVNDLYGKLPRILNLVRTVGTKSGIDWEATQLGAIELAARTDEMTDDSKVYDVTFSSNDQEFSLIVFMTETEKGWRLTGPPSASWIELE